MNLIMYTICFFLMGLIVFWDLRSGKIPNVLLAILLVINICFMESSIGSGAGLWQTLGEMSVRIGYALLIMVFLFPFFSVGAIGAGDVKLIAIAALVVERPFLFFFSIFAIAAVLGILKVVINRNALQRIRYLGNYFQRLLLLPGVPAYTAGEEKLKASFCIHLSCPVFLALVFMFILEILN